MKWKGKDFNTVTRAKGFDAPLKWKDPQRIFVNPWSDFFLQEADDWREEAWDTIHRTPHHTYLILTKRVDRIYFHLPWITPGFSGSDPWPNVWLGFSAENQRQFDKRWAIAKTIPAAKWFVSLEPLLGPVDLIKAGVITSSPMHSGIGEETEYEGEEFESDVDWIIVGGESGGPEYRRLVEQNNGYPCHGPSFKPKPEALKWVRSIWDQCQAAGIPYFFKQWGGPRPDSGGSKVDGREWKEIPQQCAWRYQLTL